MSNFNGFILTTEGRKLLAKALSGELLTFTKLELGDGVFTGDIKTLTALINKKNDFLINQIKNMNNGEVLLKAIMSNKNITTGYYIKEIGIFAKGNDNVEVLYAYNKAIEADFFPAFNSSNIVEFEYQNYIIIDQAKNVTALIDPSTTYITKDEAFETYVLRSKFEDDVRNEIAYLSGAPYGGKFGTDLKNIVAGNSYLYFDSNGKGTIYKALNTKSNAAGFLVPNSLDFVDITNSKISKYESFFEIKTIISTNGVPMAVAINFQKVGRVVDFSIMNVGTTSNNALYAEDFNVLDFNDQNYFKFKPNPCGMAQDDGTFWIKEFTLNRSNSIPFSTYELILASRFVLFSHKMSIYGCNSLGGLDFLRIEGSYIAEN